ncbi:MAG: TonB family protein [Candidatus Eiseniibacteriota bacterium]|nr:MAG: TonB family protein [Candidatus Eisenbacteria bacterium]
MRSSARSRRDLMRFFIGTSALIHVAVILTLPLDLIMLPGRGVQELNGQVSELTMLRVMEIASSSLIVSEYAFDASEKPSLPPEVDLAVAVELAEFPPPVAPSTPVSAAHAKRGRQGNAQPEVASGTYSAPVPVIMMWPDYPSSARRRGVRGTVNVRVRVTSEGKVDRAEVVSGLEDAACRRAALEAAAKLRFLPATLDGKPVDAWFSYPVEFGRKR